MMTAPPSREAEDGKSAVTGAASTAEGPGSPPAAEGAARSSGTGAGVAPRVPLSRARILAAAVRLVEDQGLAALTFRRLGRSLGCEAMSLYHHYPSKRHLQDAMVEFAIAGIPEPAVDLDPIARLRFLGWEYRAMAHRYPRLFPLIALHRLNMPVGVAFIERMLGHFHAAVPDDRRAAQAFRIFGYYVIGAALDETSGYAAGPSAADAVPDDFITRSCPRLAAAAPFFKRSHFENTFEMGLELLLKGIADLRLTVLAGERVPKPVVRPKA